MEQKLTLRRIQFLLVEYHGFLADEHKYGTHRHEELAKSHWNNAGMNLLKEPTEADGFGGRLQKEYNGPKLYMPMTEKQAFWVALAWCKVNNIDMETVNKYWK